MARKHAKGYAAVVLVVVVGVGVDVGVDVAAVSTWDLCHMLWQAASAESSFIRRLQCAQFAEDAKEKSPCR